MTDFSKVVLVERLMDFTGERRDKTAEHVDYFLKMVRDRLAAGHQITLEGFGSFKVTPVADIAPGHGLPDDVEQTVLFSPDREFLEMINA